MPGITQMLMLGEKKARVVFVGNVTSNTGTFTLPGAGDPSRVIVVAASFSGTGASGITVAGNACVVQGTGGGRAAVASIADTASTTTTVTCTGANPILTSFAVYALFGVSGATAFAGTGNAGLNFTLNIPKNGVCIACVDTNNSSTGVAWSGLTIDYSAFPSSTVNSSASATFNAAVTPQSVVVTASGGLFGICGASWGP